MNKKFKFTSAFLSAGLLITPVSGLVNNYGNVAKANEKIKSEENINISTKDIEIGNIIKDYIVLYKKNNIYQYKFYKNEELLNKLKEYNYNISLKDIEDLTNELNKILIQENGQGPLTESIDKIRNENKYNYNNLLRGGFWCSMAFNGLGTYASTVAGIGVWGAGLALGPALAIPAVVGFGIGAIGAGVC